MFIDSELRTDFREKNSQSPRLVMAMSGTVLATITYVQLKSTK